MSVLAAVVDWQGGIDCAGVVRRMLAPAVGWAPDGLHVAAEPGIGIGFGQVAVLHRERGHPFDLTSNDVLVVADARWDEPDDLARRLEIPATSSPAAVVGAAYRKWGVAFPSQLRGDFAVAIWDRGRRRLIAARDKIGIRPLFYRWTSGCLTLASDVEQIVVSAGSLPAPDAEAIIDDLLWDYRDAQRTFFEGVRRLPGGHVLIATADSLFLRRYWSPEGLPALSLDREEAAEAFRGLFLTSVRRRLASDSPVLMHLSGGLDSSSIVCAADRLDGSRPGHGLRAVAAVHPGLECDEEPFIAAVEAHVSIPVERWDGTRPEFRDLDEPALALPGARTATMNGTHGDMTIAARVGSKVILSGLGGDEVGTPSGLLEEMGARHALRSVLRETVWAKDGSMRARRVRARVAARGLLSPRWLGIWRRRKQVAAPRWFNSAARALVARRLPRAIEPLNVISRICARHWEILTGARLAVVIELQQRQALEHGMEARFPFLDPDLIEFVLALPYGAWPPPRPYSRLHRQALRPLLPREVADRRVKTHFLSAIAHRVRAAEERIRAILGASRWLAAAYVDKAEVMRLFDDLLAGGPSAGDFAAWNGLWSVVTLEVWLRRLLSYPTPP